MSTNEHPQQLGKYKINSLLGQGAMGAVYKAFDIEIDREVAIKILHTHLLTSDISEDLIKRFNNEVKAAARCQHPNIVTIYDYGINKNQPYMVMEYVKGINLQIFLKSKQILTIEQTINLISKVLDALHNAHNMGVIHRDIKPANIILLDNGQVKVTDFGVARLDSSNLTQIGDVIGTPLYMSPEARAGEIATSSSDLYSTALVLLELLIQKRLKSSEITYTLLFDELSEKYSDKKIIENIADVLKTALQEKPENRYSDASSFSKALNDCLTTHSDYYQVTNDLASTVLSIKDTIKESDIKENMDSIYSIAASSISLQNELTVLEKKLTHYLGPIAKMLVKKQAKTSSNMTQLIYSLVSHIPSEIDKQTFINSINSLELTNATTFMTNSNKTSANNNIKQPSFSELYIESLSIELSKYLGPVAKHIIKSTLKKASTKQELCHYLADKIPTVKERTEFLKNALTLE